MAKYDESNSWIEVARQHAGLSPRLRLRECWRNAENYNRQHREQEILSRIRHAGWCFAIPHAASGGGTSLARLIPLQLYEAAAGALLSQNLVRKGEGKDDAEALS
jgi:hypothetical protein